MSLLLDTHVFLWFVEEDPRLSSRTAEAIESEPELLLSVASLWQIAIKVRLEKLKLSEDYETLIPQQLNLNNIGTLPISFEHLTLVAKMPLHHRDPFDRLIIAQAMAEDITLVSRDKKFDEYAVKKMWL